MQRNFYTFRGENAEIKMQRKYVFTFLSLQSNQSTKSETQSRQRACAATDLRFPVVTEPTEIIKDGILDRKSLKVRHKLHYTDTGYIRTCCTTPPTDELTTIIYNLLYNKFATSQCQSPTSRHVKMLGCGKVLSVGGVVQHVRSRCPCSGAWHLAVVSVAVRRGDCGPYTALTIFFQKKT